MYLSPSEGPLGSGGKLTQLSIFIHRGYGFAVSPKGNEIWRVSTHVKDGGYQSEGGKPEMSVKKKPELLSSKRLQG